LTGANLTGANLIQANLSNTNLTNTNFKYANLIGSNLANAQLNDTNFSMANLAAVDLSTLEVSKANFFAANIPGTLGLPLWPPLTTEVRPIPTPSVPIRPPSTTRGGNPTDDFQPSGVGRPERTQSGGTRLIETPDIQPK
jgi:hypothetical protein